MAVSQMATGNTVSLYITALIDSNIQISPYL